MNASSHENPKDNGSRDTCLRPCPDKRNYQTPAAQILQDMGMGYYLEVVTGEVESSENEG